MSNCRLCFSTEYNQKIDLFSDIGIELQMTKIITEHFKCDVSEFDSLPNIVCQECWSTTVAFHELYQRSHLAQTKFLDSIIKTENDLSNITEINHVNIEHDFVEDQSIDLNGIKMELIPECDVTFVAESISSCDDNYVEHENQIDNFDSISETESTAKCNKTEDVLDKITNINVEIENSRKWMTQRRSTLFAEHKHLFNMTCDHCPLIFQSYDEARFHYPAEHNIPSGYIKCCNRKLRFIFEIDKHIQYYHLNPDKLKCKTCNKRFKSMNSLKLHRTQHKNSEEKFMCNICKKSYRSKKCLIKHSKSHSKDGIDISKDCLDKIPEHYKQFMAENFDMKCDNCDAMFNSLHDARYHYKEFHNNDKGYVKCCRTKLRKQYMLVGHINSHWNQQNFKCDCCDKNFKTAKSFNEHKKRQSRALICDICGKVFKTKESISNHFITTHLNSERKYECQICHNRFKLETGLKSHLYSVHRDKKPTVTCEICGKSFRGNFFLIQHMRTHSDKSERLEERKQCEHCGEWLMTKSGIYYHKQIHTSGAQKCKHCDMELPNINALQGHIRKYHRERNFKCSFCEKAFTTRTEVKKHEEYHTRHKQYPCQLCDKVFTVPSSLRTHIRRSHPDEHKIMTQNKKRGVVQ